MRTKQVLDGVWDFQWYGEEKPQFPMHFTEISPVPGCFDLMEPHCGKRGYAVYRRFVKIGGKIKLFIDGLGMEGTVYWDGKQVGECKYAYMPEDFYFDAGEEGKHELTVIIDNRYNFAFTPDFDFYGYGGIYGSVVIERVPEHAVTQVLIATEDYTTGLISIKAKAANGYTGRAQLSFDTGNGPELAFKDGVLSCQVKVPDFQLWDMEHPYLHELTLRTETDEVTESFGIRLFTTQGRKLLLNNQEIKLLGYNRHESFPTIGAAMPLTLMASDLKLIKEQGCNFIRGSHYPQRRSFLEMCDRMGMLVWEETLGWGIQAPKLHSKELLDMQLEQARKMTVASFNNPCIIIRGYLNENDSTQESTRTLIKAIYDEIRSIDGHCLISYASNKYQEDVCTDLVDIVSMNPYPGWYDSSYDNISTIDRIRPVLQELSDALPKDKPFLITELGAEALYGFRDPLKTRWSEEYQTELLMEACRYALESDDCAGISIWHFSDTRSYVNGPEIYARAKGFNNKGVLDEYRRPKLAWYALKQLFKSEKRTSK